MWVYFNGWTNHKQTTTLTLILLCIPTIDIVSIDDEQKDQTVTTGGWWDAADYPGGWSVGGQIKL